jgi:uncharacterized protein
MTADIRLMNVDIPGPAGLLEGLINAKTDVTPKAIAVLAHPLPTAGGTMHTKAVFHAAKALARIDMPVLRFNFRGVGRSQGYFDNGPGELADAASALDWLQTHNPDSSSCWIAGVSFGTWISMQLLMRRPEIDGFVCIAPPANLYDYSFLAPCPSSGLLVSGEKDRVVPSASVAELSVKTKAQKGIKLEHVIIPSANHFFEGKHEELKEIVGAYVDKQMAVIAAARKEAE